MNNSLKDYIHKKKYRLLRQLEPGHTGCQVLLIKTLHDEKIIIKYAQNTEGKREIRNNIRGYEAVKNAGADQLLPCDYKFASLGNLDLLELPYLGQNISTTLKKGGQILWEDFWRLLEITINPTLKSENKNADLMFDDYLAHLHAAFQTIDPDQYIKSNKLMLAQVHKKMSSSVKKWSLMLLDFTPDNIFFDGTNIKYVDPWDQKTYTGSFLPSIGQFVKLSRDIYKLPTTKGSEFIEGCSSIISNFANNMGLSQAEVEAQIKLGEALQLALSSMVRLEKDPETASEYYNECINTLKEIIK